MLTNVFINQIYEKVNLKFKTIFKYLSHKHKLKKFRKSIIQGSPSFGVLWKMADFIKLAELIFFYDNCSKNRLFSSSGYAPGQNGFKINREEIGIVVKLYSDDEKVVVEINRKSTEYKTTTLKFIKDEWVEEYNEYDIMLLNTVVTIINSEIIALFDDCYAKYKV